MHITENPLEVYLFSGEPHISGFQSEIFMGQNIQPNRVGTTSSEFSNSPTSPSANFQNPLTTPIKPVQIFKKIIPYLVSYPDRLRFRGLFRPNERQAQNPFILKLVLFSRDIQKVYPSL